MANWLLHHGNGITYTFSDNSVAEIMHSETIKSDINEKQKEAICSHMERVRGVVDTDLRFEFGIDELPQTGLKIKSIDSAAGIVYFENDTGLQIEVCRFTRHNKGPHEGTEIYSDRIGKRYKPWNLIPYGATEWAVPDIHRQGKRIYLKFCTFNPETKQRSELTKVTVVVASLRDMYNTGNTKIFLDDFN